jgi:uncharacterized membrane protein YqjE
MLTMIALYRANFFKDATSTVVIFFLCLVVCGWKLRDDVGVKKMVTKNLDGTR